MSGYELPQLSNELMKRITGSGFTLTRNSKKCITLSQNADRPMAQQYARRYVFHLPADGSAEVSFNLNEYTSTYKRATIWLKRSELELMLDIEAELRNLLENGALRI